MAYPQHPDYGPYYQPLEEMPASVQELFSHNPAKARELLAEAGYPDGFAVEVQVCACSPTHMDLVPLLEDYLAQVGVRLLIEPMEYASFSVLDDHPEPRPRLSDGQRPRQSHHHPCARASRPGRLGTRPASRTRRWTARLTKSTAPGEEVERIGMIRELTVEMLDRAPYLWLPIGYAYTAWWPWGEELRRRTPGRFATGPARSTPAFWIDQAMKRSLGFE